MLRKQCCGLTGSGDGERCWWEAMGDLVSYLEETGLRVPIDGDLTLKCEIVTF